jgi:hypothetical protein
MADDISGRPPKPLDEEGETPRERYFEQKLVQCFMGADSIRDFAAWSRVLGYWADWCEEQVVLRVLFDDARQGTWSDAAELLNKSKQAVHQRWAPRLKGKGLRALYGLMPDPPWRPTLGKDDS